MFRSVLIGCCILSLMGCSENGSLGQEGSPAWKWQNSKSEQKAYWVGKCRDYGFKVGTDAMAECVQRESNPSKK